MSTKPYEYVKLTWEEINEAVEAGKVCIIPAATIEDHGLHLPVDTDVVIAETICRAAAELIPDEVVLLPCINIGYSPHHIDGPGVLTIRWDTFINYVRDITSSLAYHGFRRILIVNGHGSNRPVLQMASRLTVVDNPDTLCASLSWWELKQVQTAVKQFQESEWTGHACELETSIYLAVDDSKVQMDRAVKDINPYMSAHFWSDLAGNPPEGYANQVQLNEYWSTVSGTGTWGDPTVATKEKGNILIQAAAAEIADIVCELKARPIRKRVPHQTAEAQKRNRELGFQKG
ncbi:creatininase family protein [Paenibacillus koleovorans]|uniref:creatininase family protein n=1 Tax=Paenibacillus koleovorans TaxID=121608 RepID=UPI0013E39E1A|nr:creatininase family protein [Paenibacillus koleovorans]